VTARPAILISSTLDVAPMTITEALEVKQEPPTIKGAAMRARIVAAAAKVFAKKGYVLTRVADITKAASTSHGNFYRHFNNKDEALIAALRSPLEELYNSFKLQLDAPVLIEERQLVQATIESMKVYARHRKLLRVMREAAARGEHASFYSLWINERSRFLKRYVNWLNGLKEAGYLGSEFDAEHAAEVLMALREQIAYMKIGLAVTPPSEEEIEQLGFHCAAIWYRGVFASVVAATEAKPNLKLARTRR
jgi:AcrR family transcriptional regulator